MTAPAAPRTTKEFRVGQIVYCQGQSACRVVADRGDSISYVPLEGYGPEWNKGKTFTAAKDLFEVKRETRSPRKAR